MQNKLIIRGARQHNLKNLDLELDKDQLIVISGLSGSGKSSLAFDTIFAEGQRRYVESLSSYARMFLDRMDKPDVDYMEGLSPAIAIEQKSSSRNPRSTVGTVTEIYDYLRLLWARMGTPPLRPKISEMSIDRSSDHLQAEEDTSSSAPRWPSGAEDQEGLRGCPGIGYQQVKVDGTMAKRLSSQTRQADQALHRWSTIASSSTRPSTTLASSIECHRDDQNSSDHTGSQDGSMRDLQRVQQPHTAVSPSVSSSPGSSASTTRMGRARSAMGSERRPSSIPTSSSPTTRRASTRGPSPR